MMLMPNSRPVRRTRRSISSRPVWVEAGGRLIQKHEGRVVHQCLAQLDPLLHSRGVLTYGAIALLLQADVPEDVGSAGAALRWRQTGHPGHVGEELGPAGRRGQAVVFGHVSQPFPHPGES